jgi:hypothetical protein
MIAIDKIPNYQKIFKTNWSLICMLLLIYIIQTQSCLRQYIYPSGVTLIINHKYNKRMNYANVSLTFNNR